MILNIVIFIIYNLSDEHRVRIQNIESGTISMINSSRNISKTAESRFIGAYKKGDGNDEELSIVYRGEWWKTYSYLVGTDRFDEKYFIYLSICLKGFSLRSNYSYIKKVRICLKILQFSLFQVQILVSITYCGKWVYLRRCSTCTSCARYRGLSKSNTTFVYRQRLSHNRTSSDRSSTWSECKVTL